MQMLKLSTVATVLVGPLLDAAGVAVTTAAIGDFNLTKNGTTAALAAGATATHSHNGHYLIAFIAGNVDTLGRLVVSANNAAHAMTAFRFQVAEANVFDALFGGGDLLKVDVTQFGDTAGTFASGIPDAKVASIAANAVNASALATDAVNEIQSGLATTANVAAIATTSVGGTVERSTADTASIRFSWPVSGATITGQVSLNYAAYGAVTGAISSLITESGKYWYTLAFNAADRPASEGTARYKLTDGTYTRYVNLRVEPVTNISTLGGGGGSDSTLMLSTTIATVTSQTVLVLTAGSGDNDVYNDQLVVITDAVTATQKAVVRVLDYVSSSKTLTLASTPGFTVTAGDAISIIAVAVVDLKPINDSLGWILSELVGTISNAGTADEEYTVTLGGVTYTVTHSGLDEDGNRGVSILEIT